MAGEKERGLSKLVVAIDENLHRKLKVLCAKKGIFMRVSIEEMIKDYLKKG